MNKEEKAISDYNPATFSGGLEKQDDNNQLGAINEYVVKPEVAKAMQT